MTPIYKDLLSCGVALVVMTGAAIAATSLLPWYGVWAVCGAVGEGTRRAVLRFCPWC